MVFSKTVKTESLLQKINASGYRYFVFTSEDSNFLNIIKKTKSAGPTDSIMKTS